MQTIGKHSRSGPKFAGAPVHPPSPDQLPLQQVYRWERQTPETLFLTQPVRGHVRTWTWAEAMDETRRMAAYLAAQNWPPGSRVVILSKNCAWWIMAELAVWMSGHVTVPIYPSLGVQSVRALLHHCEPVACFLGVVEDKQIMADAIPEGIQKITFPLVSDSTAIAWDAIVAETRPMTDHPVRPADDLATIIYTSGTTGAPKGAMHQFSSFVYFATASIRTTGERKGGRMLSYLPLAHIAERALVEAVSFQNASQLFFVENIDTFMDDLKRARPTVFFSVPRLYVKFQQKILAKVPQRKLDRLLAIPILSSYVRRKILRELGLDRNGLSASGGASLPVSTLLWFRKLGLNLVEGYGMTETGITHTPPDGRSKPGYVGDSVPGVETKIDVNGEVLVRSPMNMVGYYRNPEATRECFTEDGFFRTGDLGELDDEGWLRIIGRVKEQFKTSKGKYVSPNPIEKLISACHIVEACCVMGAETPQPFAMITPTQETRERLEQPDGKAFVEGILLALMQQVNEQLEMHERLQFIVVSDHHWTVANGMLTPTMKLKRSILEQNYRQCFEAWSAENAAIVWHSLAPGSSKISRSGV